MTELRKDLPPLPRRMVGLPVDDRGYPVPWFVHWIDGKPDFRVIRPGGVFTALTKRACWLCGDQIGRYAAFVIGPMCAINRISSEPPSHRDCAEFAVKVCPFLVLPNSKRRDANLPEETREAPGTMIRRNPGVSLLWVSETWRPTRTPKGLLIDVGAPTHVSWWREGRGATRDEVLESINSGLPELLDIAAKEGPKAVEALEREASRAMLLVPEAA